MKARYALLTIMILAPAVLAMDAAQRVAQGQRSLEAGDFAAADAELRAALSEAESRADSASRNRARFYLARTQERWIESDPSQTPRLTEAITQYEKLVADEPSSAVAMNNLARLYAQSGDPQKDARADALYRRAVDVPGDLQPFFTRNYAEFLAARGRKDEAVAMFTKVLGIKPDDHAAAAGLLAIDTSSRSMAHVWRLLDAGGVGEACDMALDAMPTADRAAKRRLMAVVAVALARQHVRPDDFDAHPVAARLGPLSADPDLRDGVRSIRRLYYGDALDPAAHSFWRVSERNEPPVQDPGLAFATLARSLGEQLRQANPKKAERYFSLAIDVSQGRDTEALIALADLYYGAKDVAQLEAFARRYSDSVFEAKGMAYRTRDWNKIYRFHVALGTMYANLGWTGNSGDPRSAIFQLEHARTAASRTNTVVEPKVIELLATSYRKASPEAGLDVALRLDAAESYVQSGRMSSAKVVLDPVAAGPAPQLKDQDKLRYEQLRDNIGLKEQRPGPAVVKPEVSYVPSSTRRNEVLAAARAYNVRITLPPYEKRITFAPELEQLLREYFAAGENKADMRRKLEGFGVTELIEPADGKGKVKVKVGDRVVTLDYVATVQ